MIKHQMSKYIYRIINCFENKNCSARQCDYSSFVGFHQILQLGILVQMVNVMELEIVLVIFLFRIPCQNSKMVTIFEDLFFIFTTLLQTLRFLQSTPKKCTQIWAPKHAWGVGGV